MTGSRNQETPVQKRGEEIPRCCRVPVNGGAGAWGGVLREVPNQMTGEGPGVASMPVNAEVPDTRRVKTQNGCQWQAN